MQPRTGKGQSTKAALLDTALTAFAELGYHQASMRTIAQRAGLSLSHAYYYFTSKEQIVAELLVKLRQEQADLCQEALDEGNTLESNIRHALDISVTTLGPYHGFGPTFLKVLLGSAQQPEVPGRDIELRMWQQVVEKSRPLPPLGIRRDLPRFLLLLSRMLFSLWAYDTSPQQNRSQRLMRNAAPVAAKFAVLSRLPVVRSLFDDLLGLMDESAAHQEGSGSATRLETSGKRTRSLAS
ncbi:TetR/AcrR family transcriptional regulator [Glutamicibacter sp. MNS18]|uniref:TetR/AcrR family transcriptional regulator n=1 Tax=Glutamicibacter sp. MNS18 TaxID=2989817 RepID=UPI0022362E68|nr:TetR/AcrR family transcriptional regulator [Glutamicibacter sp. MNS18]MCW4465835.1 TetR/AcrR family transcriptional regulator [Glutamicibacter sp. MNS18]